MTFGVRHVVGVTTNSKRAGWLGTKAPLFGSSWENKNLFGTWTAEDVWKYLVGCHLSHTTELAVAVLCYRLFFADGTWLTTCAEFKIGWVGHVIAFNLACEFLFVGFWHWLVYASSYARGLKPVKFNPVDQYDKTSNLQREVTFTTLGWLQSAGWQCLLMWLWASKRLPIFYTSFWSSPVYSVLLLKAVTYWREIHFYWAHRSMHPWFRPKRSLFEGDIGAFLYRHAHSLHHKSHNPGPWSGLSMHPIEHFIYYSCAWLPPLLFSVHPLHFLYAKFHADIAPIGGHDGYGEPSANGDFHYLHHHKFECNYGVPFPINFDKIFGSYVDFEEFKANGGKLPAALKAE